jgi:recombination protein RecA
MKLWKNITRRNQMTKAGKIDLKAMQKLVNKKTGLNVAHNLNENNPTIVKEWIPTGSRWLDSITCRGRLGGIPVGKITEIAGLSGAGKSFMAAQIAANAQKKGKFPVYFDAESAIDPHFLESCGVDTENLMYVQAISVEKVLETIETLIDQYEDTQFIFIWDSIAATSSEKELESDFNPQSTMSVKPRIFGKAFPKLTIPLANGQHTLLLINQLKTNINVQNPMAALIEPYIAPGGKAIEYFCSMRIWLTKRKSKAAYLQDETGLRIGSEVKCKLQKSRFGTEGRECTFKILWSGGAAIQDEESWLLALKSSGTKRLKLSGAWYTLVDKDGKEIKFQGKQWKAKLQDPHFRQTVLDIMDEEIVKKFDSEGKNFGVSEDE